MKGFVVAPIVLVVGLSVAVLNCSRSSDDENGVQSPRRETGNGQTPTKSNGPTPTPSHESEVAIKGRSLKITEKPGSGDLAFGVVYTLAGDNEGLSWLMTYSTDITEAELKQLPQDMYWNLIYQIGGDTAMPTTDASALKIDKNRLKLGQFKLSVGQKGLAEVILMQKHGFIAFGTSPENAAKEPSFVINIGALCQSSPKYFSNLTNGKSCSEIKLADVGLE